MAATHDNRVDYEFLLFYVYINISNPQEIVEWIEQFSIPLEIGGRIRVAVEGANGIIGGAQNSLHQFKQNLESSNFFSIGVFQWYHSGLVSNIPSEEQKFDNLSVKVTKEVVSLDLKNNYVLENVLNTEKGQYLSPVEFHACLKALDEGDNNICVIDIRNQYEVRIGKFEGEQFSALNPETRQFSDISKYFDDNVDDFKGKKVLMYCTGGVRCERATAYLKYKGVNDVYHLKGGIHAYQSTYGDKGFFKGKNFVFDPRISISNKDAYQFTHNHNIAPTESIESFVAEKEKIIGKCLLCEKEFDNYISKHRCTICRMLVLVCSECVSRDEIENIHLVCELCDKNQNKMNSQQK